MTLPGSPVKLCTSRVEIVDSRVWADSTAPGRGAGAAELASLQFAALLHHGMQPVVLRGIASLCQPSGVRIMNA